MDRTDLKILSTPAAGRAPQQPGFGRPGRNFGSGLLATGSRPGKDGVITGYAALLDRKRVNLNLCAFVHVTLSRHVQESTTSFEEAILGRSGVLECFRHHRRCGFHPAGGHREYREPGPFLEDFLFALPQISQVRSNIALRELEFETALPLTPSDTFL